MPSKSHEIQPYWENRFAPFKCRKITGEIIKAWQIENVHLNKQIASLRDSFSSLINLIQSAEAQKGSRIVVCGVERFHSQTLPSVT